MEEEKKPIQLRSNSIKSGDLIELWIILAIHSILHHLFLLKP